jgi:hypothetical protein
MQKNECPDDKRPFEAKLQGLLKQIASDRGLSEKLRRMPRQTLRELGFRDAEIEAFDGVSFDIVVQTNPSAKPCFPDKPTTVIRMPATKVTGDPLLIDLEDFDVSANE